jgi:uncharacterized protein
VNVDIRFGVRIPLRDGVELAATLYAPRSASPRPCLTVLTPYTADYWHDRALSFAEHGFTFFTVDVRGRGDSQGRFQPFFQEVEDGHDVVEWIARHPLCDGRVATVGGSYSGFAQWAAAKTRPPHLAAMIPVAAAHAGVDFPFRSNISLPYLGQWLSFTQGRTLRSKLFGDEAFWRGFYRERFEAGASFASLADAFGGEHAETLRGWISHAEPGPYFDAAAPSSAEYAGLDLPILTVTGAYDDDQPGALAYYRRHMAAGGPGAAKHDLLIGPWDHAGTRTPTPSYAGVTFGESSVLDMAALQAGWLRWALDGGERPALLRKPVTWFVMGAERWRSADSLEAVTVEMRPLFLGSTGSAHRLTSAGVLGPQPAGAGEDRYVYDPTDLSIAAVEASAGPDMLTDDRVLMAMEGRRLVFETAPFETSTELSGFFALEAWISLDQPDTDFRVAVYEVSGGGRQQLLSFDQQRARYRESLRKPALITTHEPLRYVFDGFTFISKQVEAGGRLRLVIGPNDSMFTQKTYNAAKPVSEQTLADARPVTVTLHHGPAHPSALRIPIGATD